MRTTRDNFTQTTIRTLAGRVGNMCSNPECRVITNGPSEDGNKTISIGVGAHITAASPNGPRYDSSLTSQERRSTDNGIWLCHNCSYTVDKQPEKYSTELLLQWKSSAEKYAREMLGKSRSFEQIKDVRNIKSIRNKPLNSEPQYTLNREETISLWKLGRESWNQWVKENPKANIDFRNVDFTKGNSEESVDVDFEHYNFPIGNIYFTNAHFGKNRVYFNHAHFNDGNIDFSGVIFENDSVSFEGAKFGKGDVNFNNVEFKSKLISFKNTFLNKGNYSFEKANFHGHADFSNMNQECSTLALSFSFNSARFEKALDLSGNKFHCVVDLLNTKIDHHVALCNLGVKLNRKCEYRTYKLGLKLQTRIALNSEDTSRLRRLKEIAHDNAHYKAALEFHAEEMRAMRWRERNFAASILDGIFSCTCNFGQSILRPICFLLFFTIFFAESITLETTFNKDKPSNSQIIENISPRQNDNTRLAAYEVATANAFSFLPHTKDIKKEALEKLYDSKTKPLWLNGISILHGLISFVLIVLIGLGLRNRFRI